MVRRYFSVNFNNIDQLAQYWSDGSLLHYCSDACYRELMAAEECEIHTYIFHFQSPFFQGESCQNINPETHNKPGYYWTLHEDGPNRVYCGMSYTGSSCVDMDLQQ